MRWGFCERCERWAFVEWDEPPRCPACGSAPDPLERVVDGVGYLSLSLELPPGSELPLLA